MKIAIIDDGIPSTIKIHNNLMVAEGMIVNNDY